MLFLEQEGNQNPERNKKHDIQNVADLRNPGRKRDKIQIEIRGCKIQNIKNRARIGEVKHASDIDTKSHEQIKQRIADVKHPFFLQMI